MSLRLFKASGLEDWYGEEDSSTMEPARESFRAAANVGSAALMTEFMSPGSTSPAARYCRCILEDFSFQKNQTNKVCRRSAEVVERGKATLYDYRDVGICTLKNEEEPPLMLQSRIRTLIK